MIKYTYMCTHTHTHTHTHTAHPPTNFNGDACPPTSADALYPHGNHPHQQYQKDRYRGQKSINRVAYMYYTIMQSYIIRLTHANV